MWLWSLLEWNPDLFLIYLVHFNGPWLAVDNEEVSAWISGNKFSCSLGYWFCSSPTKCGLEILRTASQPSYGLTTVPQIMNASEALKNNYWIWYKFSHICQKNGYVKPTSGLLPSPQQSYLWKMGAGRVQSEKSHTKTNRTLLLKICAAELIWELHLKQLPSKGCSHGGWRAESGASERWGVGSFTHFWGTWIFKIMLSCNSKSFWREFICIICI